MDKQKYICVAKCPELDSDNSKHCIVTIEERREREEKYGDYCPCGNREKWEQYNEG